MSPTSAAKRQDTTGDTVRYAFADTCAGRAVIGLSRRGVCFVALGDDDSSLLADLELRFAGAEVAPCKDEDSVTVGAVAGLIDDPSHGLAVPLDVRGTAFQRRVWEALLGVMPGQTVTYGELARLIGRPTAARAVAQACGANPLAVVIPCHRVVAADGSLGGYRWGADRKRALLARERRQES